MQTAIILLNARIKLQWAISVNGKYIMKQRRENLLRSIICSILNPIFLRATDIQTRSTKLSLEREREREISMCTKLITHLSGAKETGDDGCRDAAVEVQSGRDGSVQVLIDGLRRVSRESSGIEVP